MSERTFSPFPLIHLALDHLKLLIAVPLGAAAVAVGFALAFGGEYVAQSSFRPQTESSELSRFSGIAAQFGMALPGLNSGGESVDFYVRLAQSRALLTSVANRQYGDQTLVEHYGAEDVGEAVEILQSIVGVAPDLNSGVVDITVREGDRELAEQINRAILDEVNVFNLERRQTRAAAEREFVEAQASQAQKDLAAAENALGAFMQQNRRYEEWPQLRFEAAKLQRQVDHLQQLYTSLTQALENARLDEVRNTPVITIIDAPEDSARRDYKLLQKAVLGAVLGLVLVLLYLFLREYLGKLRTEYPEEYAKVRARQPWMAVLLVAALMGCSDDTLFGPQEFPVEVVQVSAAMDHTCALSADGDVYCWGYGLNGELGNGKLESSPEPQLVTGGVKFKQITSGGGHVCGLDGEGAAWCWGWNPYFQRGNSTDTATARPVRVSGGRKFTVIDAGQNHTCGLDAAGDAWCWGFNRFGQLGNGTTNTASEPSQVIGGRKFVSISAGGNHTCGNATSGTGGVVYCWGLNTMGQLGIGAEEISVTLPTRTSTPLTMESISAGWDHTCGVAATILYCWGGNAHGQLANGTAFSEGLPGAVAPQRSPTGIRFRSVVAGNETTCGFAVNGQLNCWGRGDLGQIGNGADSDQFYPQTIHLVPGVAGASDILNFRSATLGGMHVCGVTTGNTIYCWGSLTAENSVRNRPTPVRVAFTSGS